MTQQELDQLVEDTNDAKQKVEGLLNSAKQLIGQKQKEAKKEESTGNAEGLLEMASRGGESLLRGKHLEHKHQAEELRKQIERLKDTVKRFENELDKLNNGLNELVKIESSLHDILMRAAGWKNSLENVIQDVESERININ